MLLYISTNSNQALLTDYIEQQGIYVNFLAYDACPSIKAAITSERALPTYDYVLFHFSALPLPKDALVASIEYIRRYHHARIIVFAPAGNESAEVFGILADMGLRELVAVSDGTNLQDELDECLSPDGKRFYNTAAMLCDAQTEMLQRQIRPKVEVPSGACLKVGAAGTQSRIGVTTQAFCMYHALKALGFTPCIVDERRTLIEALIKVYRNEAVIDASIVKMRGVDFSKDINPPGYNALILDLGVLSKDNAPKLNKCDLRFLCAGSKAWEILSLAKAVNTTEAEVHSIIFSFVSSDAEDETLELLGGRTPGSFAPWRPGLWNASSTEWHENLMLPLIKEALQL